MVFKANHFILGSQSISASMDMSNTPIDHKQKRYLLDAERRLGGLVLALGDAGRVELVDGVDVAPTALQVDSES